METGRDSSPSEKTIREVSEHVRAAELDRVDHFVNGATRRSAGDRGGPRLRGRQNLDLKRGMVKLDRNKTDDPRSWALDAGVHAALVWWREQRADESMGQLVFRRPDGAPHEKTGLAGFFRTHLARIGLKDERPELFETTAERQRIRVHDLRGTFVTIALTNGRSESWIADRTGHRSSAMIAKYKRTARSFQELGLGQLTPLADVIPEIGVSTKVNSDPTTTEDRMNDNAEMNWRPQRELNPCYRRERPMS
jgi:hypothetical protein